MFPFPNSLINYYYVFLCWWQMLMETKTCFCFHHSLKWNQKHISVSSCHLFVINLLSIYGTCSYSGSNGTINYSRRSSWQRGMTQWWDCRPSAPHCQFPSPDDVGPVVFPCGAASQAFQAGHGGRGFTRKNVIFSNSLWTNSEYPISLKSMSIWSL